tara:strand:- start:428 stop:739 length:312 start_codon:yes stop_codon:yes gene_type:complete
MLNRVNIQYSIELNDLPEEVDRIYRKATQTLNNINLPAQTGKDLLTSDTLKEIDAVRRELTSLDQILCDVSGIVGSFVEYEVSQINTSNQDESNAENTTEMSI